MKAVEKATSPTRSSFFKEEREEGVIYGVSFKKVRYRRSDTNYLAGSEEPVSHLQWETILIRKIKAGTLAKLVENLVSINLTLLEDADPFLVAFLSTYRAFAEVEEVLELLLERCIRTQQNQFDKPEEYERVMKGLVGVLTVWLDQFSSDFNEPPTYKNLKRMNDFVDSQMNEEYKKDLSKKIKEKLQTFIITPYESEGDPMSFRLSLLKDIDYIVEADKVGGSYEGLDFDLLSINPSTFAEQLTLMDAELFRKVIPWHCLGSIWSNRRKNYKYNTVKATVDQFNAVSLRVVSTILTCSSKIGSAPSKRAKFITHWINVAQECRDIKNFSSLKAIISGLQSAPIHRLKKTWMNVPRDWQVLFAELSSIFSEDKNQKMSRDLLMKEGTAKRAEADITGLKRLNSLKKRRSRLLNTDSVMQGTVPYLGTFLTDLMMLDAAHPDYLEDGMINFDKKRKEFEIIAQIKLLQAAAKNYNIVPSEKFRHSFDTFMTFSENESFNLSCEVEKDSVKKKTKKSTSLRRNLSEPDIPSLTLSPDSIMLHHQESKSTENSPVMSRHRRNNSCGSSASSSSGGSETSSAKGLSIAIKRQSSPCFRRLPSSPVMLSQRASLPPLSSSCPGEWVGHIIRVSLEDDTESGLMYKGVWLAQDERTPKVIKNCLLKHSLPHETHNEYCLVQQLPNGNELVFPDHCNIYYAINSSVDSMTFQLRKKHL